MGQTASEAKKRPQVSLKSQTDNTEKTWNITTKF